MFINHAGQLTPSISPKEIKQHTAQKVFHQVKNIHSIFMDNSTKTSDGFFINKESMSNTIKILTTYLKNNP